MSEDPRYIRRAAKKIRRLENGQTAVFQFEDSRVKIIKIDDQLYIHPVGEKYDVSINGVSIFERTPFTLNDIIGIGDITLYLRNPSKRRKHSSAAPTDDAPETTPQNSIGDDYEDSPDLSNTGSTEDSAVNQTEDSAPDPPGGLPPHATEQEADAEPDHAESSEERQEQEQPQAPVSYAVGRTNDENQEKVSKVAQRFIKVGSFLAIALLLIVVIVVKMESANTPEDNSNDPTINVTDVAKESVQDASVEELTNLATTAPTAPTETQEPREETPKANVLSDKLDTVDDYIQAFLANKDSNGLEKAKQALERITETEPQLADNTRVIELQDRIRKIEERHKFDASLNSLETLLTTFRQEDNPELLEQARQDFNELKEQYPNLLETTQAQATQARLLAAVKLEGVKKYWREYCQTQDFEKLKQATTVAEEFNREGAEITQSDEFKELLEKIQQARAEVEADAKAFNRAVNDINNSFRLHKLDRDAALTAQRTARTSDEKRKVKDLFEKISEEFDLVYYLDDGDKSGEEKAFYLENDLELQFVWCAPGTFQMGSPPDESGHKEDETLRQVELTQGFWILKTEVTQALYDRVMESAPVEEFEDYAELELPITNVSWAQAMAFCEELTARFMPSEYEFTLPTEAQWEYACRAGTQDAYACDKKDIVFKRSTPLPYTSAADKAQAPTRQNAWGICDMPGNVYEWCRDQYGAYETADDQENATKDPLAFDHEKTDARHVIRGGSYRCEKQTDCRSAARRQGPASFTSLSSKEKNLDKAVGFRVVIARKRYDK
ncbi:MAG: SUMF1/EgtB/PvdO family nonheme iron enzyme [Planctomycetia bacterium]|nr:SUMF1/EgtB/PvdO family nonheme iron enzyme [Planctomycetia bacterium]